MAIKTKLAALLLLAVAVGPARADDGPAVYKASCAQCHGSGPAPTFVGKSVEDVKAAVSAGKGKMAAVKLSPADLEAVAQYTAASGKSPPAAPAR
jgi:mono/diheme cytochrome c family protein